MTNSPRGYNRVNAAAYIGVSPNTFDKLVKDGTMPRPIKLGARLIWDVRDLDKAFDKLKGTAPDEENYWDVALGITKRGEE